MADDYTRENHRAGKVCQGGPKCPHCRRAPTSSAGQRRKAKDKAASRRVARARVNRDIPEE
jgi:hypothetical protein